MPELPEVEACRRNLAAWSRGRVVEAVRVIDPGAVRAKPSTRPAASPAARKRLEGIVGRKPGALHRAGKRLTWRFGHDALLLHLGMTGRWVRREGDEVPAAARVGLVLDGDRTLWFLDARRFGSVVPLPADAAEAALTDGLGPDALDAPPDGPGLAAALAGRRAIKVALMDQARIAGIGNIQAVEALFRARIHPATPAAGLDAAAWRRLAKAIPEQLEHAIRLCEHDEIAYLSDRGDVENPFEVYGRAGEPCVRCGTPIAASRLGGRTTTWCPSCQPAADRA